MVIRKKLDAMHFLEDFTSIASFDYEKEKHYFVFKDKDRGGQYTLMKKGELWSIHGKGEKYCDQGETAMNNIDELLDFLWKHRSKINLSLKEMQEQIVNV